MTWASAPARGEAVRANDTPPVRPRLMCVRVCILAGGANIHVRELIVQVLTDFAFGAIKLAGQAT